MNLEYLETVVREFCVPARRDRFLQFLRSPKRYSDAIGELLRDPRSFSAEVIVKLPACDQTPAEVYRRLRQLGASGDAYVMSASGRFEDGTIESLSPLLTRCVGCDEDVLIFCPDAKVAYYEGHEGWRYLLRSAKPLTANPRSRGRPNC